MRPIVTYFDAQKLWIPDTFAKYVMRSTIQFLKAQYGFSVISQLLHHFEKITDDQDVKISIIEVISFIIDIQKGTAGPRAIEVLAALLKHLLATINVCFLFCFFCFFFLFFASPPNISNSFPLQHQENQEESEKEKKLQNSLMESIARIARRGVYTTLNIDMMTFILTILRDCNPEAFKKRHVLLRSVLMISVHPAELPPGKHYPDNLLNPLLDELIVENDPESRLLAMNVFQSLIFVSKSQAELNLVDYSADHHQQQQQQAQAQARAKEKQGKFAVVLVPSESGSNSNLHGKETTLFSGKQVQALYAFLYRSIQMSNNDPQHFELIFKLFKLLLRQYRNKNIKYAVPLMLRLQQICIEESEKVRPIGSGRINAIHALIAAYFILIAKEYRDSELELYVNQILSKRAELKQQTSCVGINTEKASLEARTGPGLSFDAEKCELVTQETALKKDVIIDILSKLDILKQTLKNSVREILSKNFDADDKDNKSTVLSSDGLNDWGKFYEDFPEAGEELAPIGAPYKELLDTDTPIFSASLAQLKSHDYIATGSTSMLLSKKAQEEMDAIIEAIPKKQPSSEKEESLVSNNVGNSANKHKVQTFGELMTNSSQVAMTEAKEIWSPSGVQLSSDSVFNIQLPKSLQFESINFFE